jgi:hypothetical protein
MRINEIINEEHGNMDLFQDSLRIVFGLDSDTVETLVAMVRRHGDTMQIRDQQVRRRAGGRAVELLKRAHSAASAEGDEHYDKPAMSDEFDDEMTDDDEIEFNVPTDEER